MSVHICTELVHVHLFVYMDFIYLLYLMECFEYACNILVVSDGIYSINLGGLQADINVGRLGEQK